MAQFLRLEVALCDISLFFFQVNTEVIAEHNNRSFINRNLELQCGQIEIDCNQERIERRGRTNQG